MKKVVLISSHCDDENKLNTLNHNVDILKTLNVDIILYSTVPLSTEITDKVTYYVFSNKNPVLKYPLKGIATWRIFNLKESNITVTHVDDDYGWAAATQYRNLLSFSISLGYQNIFLMVYDIDISDEIIDVINNETKTKFFPTKRNDDTLTYHVGVHFMSLDRESANKLINKITINEYLSDLNVIFENFIKKFVEDNGYEISDTIVKDTINRYVDPFFNERVLDLFNVYFINDTLNHNFYVLFFNVSEDLSVTVKTEKELTEKKIIKNENTILKIQKPNKTIKFIVKEKEIDFSQKLNKLKYSKMTY